MRWGGGKKKGKGCRRCGRGTKLGRRTRGGGSFMWEGRPRRGRVIARKSRWPQNHRPLRESKWKKDDDGSFSEKKCAGRGGERGIVKRN